MKQNILALIVLIFLAVSSCKKDQTEIPQGSWTFLSKEYQVTGGANIGTQFNALSSTYNATNNATLYLSFGDSVFYPTPVSVYAVVKYPPAAHQVSVMTSQSDSGQTYSSTGGNGTETITVSLANGRETVSGKSITVAQGINANAGSTQVSFSMWSNY